MMTRRRCCCPSSGTGTSGCWTFEDPFTREDSTDVGADWEEQGGTGGPWQILDDKLSVATTSKIARIYVNDSANRCELERTCAGWGRLRLFDGDTPKSARYVPLSANMQIVVCCDGDQIHASVGAAELITIPATVVSSVTALGTGDGDKITCLHQVPADVGTGTGDLDHYLVYADVTITEDAIAFDEFVISEHFHDNPDCPKCRREDCEWFTDVAVPSGSLSDADYLDTLGTGTSAASWAYAGGVKVTEDGTLALNVESPKGITGSITWHLGELMLHADEGATVDFYFDDSDSFVRVTRDVAGGYPEGSIRVDFYSGGELFGFALYIAYATYHSVVFQLCWDGATFTGYAGRIGGVGEGGVATAQSVTLPHAPTEFAPRIVVEGLTAGYVLITGIEADKDGSLVEPPRACDTCQDPYCFYCADGTYPRTVQVSITGLTLRVTDPNGHPYEPPYGVGCPDPLTAELTAQQSMPFIVSRGAGCGWSGLTEKIIPYSYYGIIYYVRGLVIAWVTPVDGGYKLSVQLTASAGQTAEAPTLTKATISLLFELTVAGDRPDCLTDYNGLIPLFDCSQADGSVGELGLKFGFICDFCLDGVGAAEVACDFEA